MSSSGAGFAQLGVAGTFTAAEIFNAGLTATAATVTGALTTAELVGAVVTKTAAYAVALTDATILCDATAAAFPVTLPAANAVPGRRITIKKIDASINAVTVASAGGTIDSAVSVALTAANMALTVVSGGANWWVVNQVATTIL